MRFSERRRSARVALHANALLTTETGENHGTVIDISLEGGLFAAHAPPGCRNGQIGRLSVHDCAGLLTFEVVGIIVHHHDKEIGFLFQRMNATTLKWLRRFLGARSGLAALLQ